MAVFQKRRLGTAVPVETSVANRSSGWQEATSTTTVESKEGTMKVMFVGNDPQAADKVNLAARLRWPEATVVTAGEDETGLEELERQAPDVLMFQPQPTVRPVNRFIEEVRTFSDVPLIVLQPPEGGDSMEEITALESGADDYIRSSAGIIDVVSRLVALVRRVKRTEGTGEARPLSSGSLLLDPTTYEVSLDGARLTLTSTEFRLCKTPGCN